MSLSQFQPIFVLCVTISAVLDPCFKAMSVVGIYPDREGLSLIKGLDGVN